jgi:hypothetical protein
VLHAARCLHSPLRSQPLTPALSPLTPQSKLSGKNFTCVEYLAFSKGIDGVHAGVRAERAHMMERRRSCSNTMHLS